MRHPAAVGILAAAFVGAARAGEVPAAAGDDRARVEELVRDLKLLNRKIRAAERELRGVQGEFDAVSREKEAAGLEEMLRYEFQGDKPLPPRIVLHLSLTEDETAAVNAAFAREAESIRAFLAREIPAAETEKLAVQAKGTPSLDVLVNHYKSTALARLPARESPEGQKMLSVLVDACAGERVACGEELWPEDRLGPHVERIRLRTYKDLEPALRPEVHRKVRRLFGGCYSRFGAWDVGGTPYPCIMMSWSGGRGHLEWRVADRRADLADLERRLREARDSLRDLEEEEVRSRLMVHYDSEKPLHDKIAAYLELTAGQRAAVDAAFRDEIERFREALAGMLAREFPDDPPGREAPLQGLLEIAWPRLQAKTGSHPDNRILHDLLRDPEILSGRKTVYLDEAAPRARHALVWGGFFLSRERTFRDLEKVLSSEQHRRLTSLLGHAFNGYGCDNYNIALRNIQAGRNPAE